MISRRKKVLSFVVTALALVVLFLFAVNTGSLKVTPGELFRGLFVAYDKNVATIYDLRFPRIFIALLGGAATAVSGVLLQAVMKNPLADPGIIGVSSGASLAAVLVTAFVPSLYFVTPLFAFLGGMLAFALVYSLSWRGGLSPLRILLVGVAVNAMFTGLMSAFNSGTGSNSSGVASIVNANITQKTWDDFQTLVGYVLIGLAASLLVTGQCNLLALEDKTARSLGVNVTRSRIVISVIAVLLASISTAVIVPISFLGLIVPHIAHHIRLHHSNQADAVQRSVSFRFFGDVVQIVAQVVLQLNGRIEQRYAGLEELLYLLKFLLHVVQVILALNDALQQSDVVILL